jgi:hypothetical protein
MDIAHWITFWGGITDVFLPTAEVRKKVSEQLHRRRPARRTIATAVLAAGGLYLVAWGIVYLQPDRRIAAIHHDD